MTPASLQAWMRKRAIFLGLAMVQCTPLLVLGWGIGRLCKDHTPTRTLTLLYALPAPAVAACCGIWFLRALNRKPGLLNGWMKAGLAAALIQCLVFDFAWHIPRDATRQESIRIVNWNLGRVRGGGERLWSALRSARPDICLITERPRSDNVFHPSWVGLPEGDVRTLDELILISEFPLSALTPIPTEAGTAFSCNVHTSQGDLLLVAIDFHSHPVQNIKASMEAILQSIRQDALAGTPIILAGDFNKPRDSIQLTSLREVFHHAYEERGNGWPYTWPSLLPLWSIDHIWCSEQINIHRYDLLSLLPSDHARQTMDFTFNP